MKQFPKTEIFSCFSILLGLAGLALQSWLFSLVDSQGLLPRGHISQILCLVLLAIAVVIQALFLKNIKSDVEYEQLFPRSVVAGAGSVIAAAGIVFTAFNPEITGFLKTVVQALGIVAGLALALGGVARFQGKRPNSMLYALVAVFLVFRTLAYCQKWSADVQAQHYFFPLLASLFLLLAAYYRAALSADIRNGRRYLCFRQLALFCCLLSIAGSNQLFYLAGAIWMVTDYCIPGFRGKYAQ